MFSLVSLGSPVLQPFSFGRKDTSDSPACDASLPESERLLLTVWALPFHGSTALHQVLMGSPNVATACMGREFQCELILTYPPTSNLTHEANYGHPRCKECRDGVQSRPAGVAHDLPCVACTEQMECPDDTGTCLRCARCSTVSLKTLPEKAPRRFHFRSKLSGENFSGRTFRTNPGGGGGKEFVLLRICPVSECV